MLARRHVQAPYKGGRESVLGPRPASARLQPARNHYFIHLFNDFRQPHLIRAVYRTVSSRPKKFRAAQKFRARPKSFAGRAEKFRAAGKSVARSAPSKVSLAPKVSRGINIPTLLGPYVLWTHTRPCQRAHVSNRAGKTAESICAGAGGESQAYRQALQSP